jgi:hypothetical protein
MPKISTREVRRINRELLNTQNNLAESARKLAVVTKEASASKNKLYYIVSRNTTLSKNVRTLYNLFLSQQSIVRQQQADIRQLNTRKKQTQSTDNEDCAKSMIAMSQLLCCECLGTCTILKTKKHIRYNVECKSCKK